MKGYFDPLPGSFCRRQRILLHKFDHHREPQNRIKQDDSRKMEWPENVKPTERPVDFDTDSKMIGPPVNRLMKVLDRSFFQKNLRLCAAHVFDPKDISKTRAELESDMLHMARVRNVVSVAGHDHRTKALILRPGIKNEGTF